LAALLVVMQALSPPASFAGSSDAPYPGSAIHASSGPPTNLQFRPHPGPEAYIGRPFEVTVAIVDAFMQVVTEGTTAMVTLAIETSPVAGAVLACTSGLARPTETTGGGAGTVTFSGCTIDRQGEFSLQATAAGVVSTTIPAPTIAPAQGGAIRVRGPEAAPQETIKVAALFEPPVITWGQTVTVQVTFTQHGSHQPFQLQQSTRTMQSWTRLADLVTNAIGVATFAYRPSVTTRYRAVFMGSPGLAAGTSATAGILLFSLAKQRPIQAVPKVIRPGTTVTFATTVRPLLGDLPAPQVAFALYHRVSGSWRLAKSWLRTADSLGVARMTLKFGSRGEWYMRSHVLPRFIDDAQTAPAVAWASRPTPIARYSVR
jgi:hypothetical protein